MLSLRAGIIDHHLVTASRDVTLQPTRGYACAIDLLACTVVDAIALLIVDLLSICRQVTYILVLLGLSSHTWSIRDVDTVAKNGVSTCNKTLVGES